MLQVSHILGESTRDYLANRSGSSIVCAPLRTLLVAWTRDSGFPAHCLG